MCGYIGLQLSQSGSGLAGRVTELAPWFKYYMLKMKLIICLLKIQAAMIMGGEASFCHTCFLLAGCLII